MALRIDKCFLNGPEALATLIDGRPTFLTESSISVELAALISEVNAFKWSKSFVTLFNLIPVTRMRTNFEC